MGLIDWLVALDGWHLRLILTFLLGRIGERS